MEQIATLEIQNSSFRVTVGYMLDDKVDIIYRKVFPLSTVINDCDIFDFDSLASDLSVIQHLEDHKLKLSINEVTLIYPPYGLDVYTTQKGTNTISQDSKINDLDILNCLSLVKKERIPNPNNMLVDVIPNLFICDGNRQYQNPPLNEISTTLNIRANIYTLPKKLIEDLKKALALAKIKVKREVIAPVGASYLLTSINYEPIHYFLINFGERTTTVSVISYRHVLASSYIPLGSDHLTEKIAKEFNISNVEAERLKKIYGYDARKNSYNPDLCKDPTSVINKGYSKDELNTVVLSFMKEWIEYLKNTIDSFTQSKEDILAKFALAFIGNGCLINGFKDYIKRFFPHNKIDIITTNTVGAEEPGWVDSLGAIYFTSIYKGSLLDNQKNKIREVNREQGPEEYKETTDTL